ncbi:electron transport complex subunit RsxG [Aliikangiella marina]|uniref:Ion-translocating oxidoreductase complex subunit G n=1 Tax=Aliikangiella marina TaxID=1712262 RepID=A0A545T336_9GAMM|nr:electron transport complex subunit RsxG [Aliikangiella marina]TQV71632.1 electron transport complex subunit RsxG [Aliikangiella marina]
MTEDNKQSPTIEKATAINGAILALFALVSTGLIAVTHLITKDKIAEEIEAALARRLNDIIPAEAYDNDVYHDCMRVKSDELLGSQDHQNVYRMRKENEDYAVFMTSVAPDGYAGKIKLVVGIYQDGTIAGVRVTEHQETPGLGDKIEIEKSSWIKSFDAKSLTNTPIEQWKVTKDGGEFDALTGATITPRAIVKAVKNTLVFYERSREELFNPDTSCGVTDD